MWRFYIVGSEQKERCDDMYVVTAEEMGQADQLAMEQVGLPGVVLMENAGRAVSARIMKDWSQATKVTVLIGTGNNGGDGFVIARGLLESGYDVTVWLIPPADKIKGDALTHMNIFVASGFTIRYYDNKHQTMVHDIRHSHLVIDTLLGTGAQGEPRPPYQRVMQEVNNIDVFVLSIDVPSGLPANGDAIFGEPIRASQTLTLQAPKLSALTYPSAYYYGQWDVVHIGIPQMVLDDVQPGRYVWLDIDVQTTLPQRHQSSHKGTHGKGCLMAGSEQMTGAPVMAAQATLKGGAGLLTVVIPDVIHTIVASQVTEAMFAPLPSDKGTFTENSTLDSQTYDAVAVGPGMGRGDCCARIVADLLQQDHGPLVIDADGLYALSFYKNKLKQRQSPTILTPHPGEMARLLDCSVADVQANRFAYTRYFAQTYHVYLVLKGPYTIVTTPEGYQYVNVTGNAGLAKGGTGDVLTGLILAFIMQHDNIQEAISNAVFIHGQAANCSAAKHRELITMTATDILAHITVALQTVIQK